MGLKRESLHSIKKEAAAMPYGTPVDELIAEIVAQGATSMNNVDKMGDENSGA